MSLPGATQSLLQSAATANGNGTSLLAYGADSAIQIEVRETAGGTCTIQFQGSFDGTNWYPVGYQRVDNQLSLARAVANLSVTANLAAVYQILDPYPQYRAVISAIAGGGTVTVGAYVVA